MSKHKIDWLNKPGYKGETWNPIIGCTKISAGCKNCYAEKMAFRINNMHQGTGYEHVISGKKWNGKTFYKGTGALDKPSHWKTPRMIFVCSMSDLFHEDNSFEDIDKIFDVMSSTPHHQYVVLTKRPESALKYFKWIGEQIKRAGFDSVPSQSEDPFDYYSPLENVWVGVTAENQEQADKRIPVLLEIPAAKRFVSVEPMLGEMDLSKWIPKGRWGIHPKKGKIIYPHFYMVKCEECGWIGSSGFLNGGGPLADSGDYDDCYCPKCNSIECDEIDSKIDWVIVGGESGHNARPMHLEWVRNILGQCRQANVSFFFKQLSQLYTKDFKNRDIFPDDLKINEFPVK